MLKTCERLRTQEVKEVLGRKSFSLRTSFFNCRFIHKAQIESFPSKFAIVITKKTAPLAVDRHRQKRRVSAALHTAKAFFPPNLLLVLFIKEDCSKVPFANLQEELLELCKKIKKG